MKPAKPASSYRADTLYGRDGRLYKSTLNNRTGRWRWVPMEPQVVAERGAKASEPAEATAEQEVKEALPKTVAQKPRKGSKKASKKVSKKASKKRSKKLPEPPAKEEAKPSKKGRPSKKPAGVVVLQGKTYEIGAVLGQGAAGIVYELPQTPDWVAKVSRPGASLDLECRALNHLAAVNMAPSCKGSSPGGMLIMQRLPGPLLECENLQSEAVAQRVLDISRVASNWHVDVSDFHTANYMWDGDLLKRIDATLVVTPDWMEQVSVRFRPLMLSVYNHRFYPVRVEQYMYSPLCQEIVPAMWYSQLAAAFEMGDQSFLDALVAESMKDVLKDMLAAYAKAGLRPVQGSGKKKQPTDKVFKHYAPILEQRAKSADRLKLFRETVQDEDFLRALQAFRLSLTDDIPLEYEPAPKISKTTNKRDKEPSDSALIAGVISLSLHRMLAQSPLLERDGSLVLADARKAEFLESTAFVWRHNAEKLLAKPGSQEVFAFDLAVALAFPSKGFVPATGERLGRDFRGPFRRAGLATPSHTEYIMWDLEARLNRAPAEPGDDESLAGHLDEVFQAAGIDEWRSLLTQAINLLHGTLRPRLS